MRTLKLLLFYLCILLVIVIATIGSATLNRQRLERIQYENRTIDIVVRVDHIEDVGCTKVIYFWYMDEYYMISSQDAPLELFYKLEVDDHIDVFEYINKPGIQFKYARRITR